ncbi:uncharacterized protein LOC128107055 [Peromyscus californicus insignis]|uniref:uncharacterized protein LOC128107055 n=1 Tax=Peromyscus californicus insignis TaxID=564181 RepID=UPI0022A77105|nr:uncharacterized protein LOC128107055 [Peromyscus californicus insignis]
MVLRGAAAAARPAPSRHFAPRGEAGGVGTVPTPPAPLHGAPSAARAGHAAPPPSSSTTGLGPREGRSGAGAGEDGGGCSVIHVDPAAPKLCPRILAEKEVCLSGVCQCGRQKKRSCCLVDLELSSKRY